MQSLTTLDVSPHKRPDESFDHYLKRIACYGSYNRESQAVLDKVYGNSRKTQGLAVLRGLLQAIDIQVSGFSSLSIEYSGGGDSGSIGEINYSTDSLSKEAQKQIDCLLDVVGWDIAYGSHPGFEINEGGQGTIDCQKNEDGVWTLSIHHEENIIQTECTEYEL